MIVFQQVIDATSTNGKYTSQAQGGNGLVSYDFLNDSPYNTAVNFGQDVGYDAAEYYLPPHGILLGIQATPARATVGQAWFTGTIYIYVQQPQGGTIILSQAPASQFTVMGYPAGARPANTVTMARMQNVGNVVNSTMGTANGFQNDNNPAGTQVGEASQVGSPQSNLLFLNDGTVQVGQYVGGIWKAILQILPGPTPHVIIGGIGESITIEDNIFLDGLTTFGSGGSTTIDGSGRYNSSQSFTLTNSGANMEPPPDSINGGTSGTATAWMDLTGTIKRCLIFLNNFRTAAAAQNLTLPTAFTSHALVRAGVAGTSATPTGMSFLKGGVAQSMRIYATPSANGDSGVGPNTTLYGGSWAEIQAGSGIDTVQFAANWGAAFTGLIEIVGQ